MKVMPKCEIGSTLLLKAPRTPTSATRWEIGWKRGTKGKEGVQMGVLNDFLKVETQHLCGL